MTELEQAKVNFSDATIALEIAQGRYNEAKIKLIELMRKSQQEDNTEKK